ncbi:MAG: hypothetical protein MUC43_05890 [Pirellula sp.]|jgi:uncharacterized protein YjiS (DUF1127 family)|nr:hypothetical protein [Pirellula sp.]
MSDTPISFNVVGAALMRARKSLKPAYPKKKQEANTPMGIVAISNTEVAFQLPGASARVETNVSPLFKFQLPWLVFKQTLLDDYSKCDSVELKVGPGFFTCGILTLRSEQIVFQTVHSDSEALEASHEQTDVAPLPDLANSYLGFPLLTAYSYMRKHGFREHLVNQGFVQMERDVLYLVSKATTALEPLGITREDIEQLIDKKFGIDGGKPIIGDRELG